MNAMRRHLLWIISILGLMIGWMPASSWAAAPFTVSFVSGPTVSGQPQLFNMVPNSAQQLKFNITSNTQDTVIIKCSITSSSLDSVSPLGGCTNPNGAGTPYPLVFSITSGNTPGNVTHTLTIQTQSGRHTVTIPINYTIVSNSSRTITFKNYCSFDVWFGIASGTLPPLSGSSCSTNSDCPTGTQCASNKCFWIPPTPNQSASNPQNTYKLAGYTSGTPASNTITIPDYSSSNGSVKLWSGGFAGRTGCTFTGNVISCNTGDCGDDGTGKGGCALGTGFTAPVTQVEPTFLVKSPDSYDVTIINGFNVPMSFTPDVQVGSSSPYDCGSPGSNTATNYTNVLYSTASPSPTGTLGACSWSFTPPNSNLYYQWVSASPGGPCTKNSDCGSNACGMTTANVTGNTAALTCGKLLGYWTQDEICAKNRNFNSASIVNCTSTSAISNCTANGTTCPVTVSGQYTFYNLLACTSSPPDTQDNALTFNTCFAAGDYSSSNCCGCINWQSSSQFTGTVPTDSTLVSQCGTSNNTTANQNWVDSVLPNLFWLKNACPSAYTYPYDDKTSSFSCPYAYEQGQSGVNYTVTFCPGQEQGGIT